MIRDNGNGYSAVVTVSTLDAPSAETGTDNSQGVEQFARHPEGGIDSSNDLDAVRAQFEDWRSRPGRRHIPDDLWLAAIRLLDYYPVSVVSEHLRLNSARLQQQQNKLLSLPSPLPSVPSTHATRRAPSTLRRARRKPTDDKLSNPQPSIQFLQLTTDPSTAQTECSIIIERGDGSRLSLRLPAERPIIEAISANFLRQS